MPQEIERKFLLKNDDWRNLSQEVQHYQQGYIRTKNHSTVRVRIAGEKGYLTLKGKSKGMTRSEYEYEIPLEQAREILQELCDQPPISKNRYKLYLGENLWEIDEFLGDNQGLILAEIELKDEKQTLELPQWIKKEVTTDARYYNSNLALNPYKNWEQNEFD